MRPVSEAFLRALRGSHTMAARARVVAPGQTGTAPTGTEIPILAGDVRLDGTADVRSTLDLTTEGYGMWPQAATDLLAPYGNEVFVERGIRLGSGSTEWCSLGYFRIGEGEQSGHHDGPIRITGQDRMAGIIDARLLDPVQFAASATYGAVLSALITEVYPTAVIEWDDATDVEAIGRAVIAEQDRFEVCDDLVRSVGKVWWWDHRGHLVVAAPPDPTAPVFTVDYGENGVLLSLSRTITRASVFNGVVAYGEGADDQPPARAAVVDTGPLSPTFWYGDFGKVPRFYSSPFITTDAQALAAATSLLTQALGVSYTADFTAVPNPALEPYDPVLLRYRGTPSRTHVLDALSIPLVADGALSASTRDQTIVLVGAP